MASIWEIALLQGGVPAQDLDILLLDRGLVEPLGVPEVGVLPTLADETRLELAPVVGSHELVHPDLELPGLVVGAQALDCDLVTHLAVGEHHRTDVHGTQILARVRLALVVLPPVDGSRGLVAHRSPQDRILARHQHAAAPAILHLAPGQALREVVEPIHELPDRGVILHDAPGRQAGDLLVAGTHDLLNGGEAQILSTHDRGEPEIGHPLVLGGLHLDHGLGSLVHALGDADLDLADRNLAPPERALVALVHVDEPVVRFVLRLSELTVGAPVAHHAVDVHGVVRVGRSRVFRLPTHGLTHGRDIVPQLFGQVGPDLVVELPLLQGEAAQLLLEPAETTEAIHPRGDLLVAAVQAPHRVGHHVLHATEPAELPGIRILGHANLEARDQQLIPNGGETDERQVGVLAGEIVIELVEHGVIHLNCQDCDHL